VPTSLTGRRFVADFEVLAVRDGLAILRMLSYGGARYVISVDELETIIERGLVIERAPIWRREGSEP